MSYFTQEDLAPYTGHMINYVAYVAPGETLIEYEEVTIINITKTVVVCEEEQSGTLADGEKIEYTNILLIPIVAIVEIRIDKKKEEGGN